jgi:hypothetical protein
MLLLPDLNSLLKPPFIFLILGIFFISAAVVYTRMGKAWGRFNGWIYRAEKPVTFWVEVVFYYLGGVWSLGYFWFRIYELSN